MWNALKLTYTNVQFQHLPGDYPKAWLHGEGTPGEKREGQGRKEVKGTPMIL